METINDMIIAYTVSNHKGFGIGVTLPKAIEHYEEHNGKLEDNVQVSVFKAKNIQDISFSDNGLNWHTRNYAELIIQLSGLTRKNLK